MSAVVATFSLPPGHPVFAGHFPDQPIVPGAWLLDQVLYAVAEPGIAAWSLASAKFLSPVAPGEVVELLLQPAGAAGSRGFELRCGERLVARGSVAPRER